MLVVQSGAQSTQLGTVPPDQIFSFVEKFHVAFISKAGTPFCDTFMVEEINPIANFYCSVTRKMVDGNVFFPEQKMTREQALQSYTVNPAYAAFEEDIKGSLAPGKLADITVFSKDIMTIPDDELLSTEVLYTIIDGKVAYKGEEGFE